MRRQYVGIMGFIEIAPIVGSAMSRPDVRIVGRDSDFIRVQIVGKNKHDVRFVITLYCSKQNKHQNQFFHRILNSSGKYEYVSLLLLVYSLRSNRLQNSPKVCGMFWIYLLSFDCIARRRSAYFELPARLFCS